MNDLMNFFNSMDKLFDANTNDYYEVSYPAPSFPPCRILMDKETNELLMSFALTGYSKEDLNIGYKNRSLIISTSEKYKQHEIDTNKYKILKNTFKKPTFSYSYLVPDNKFDISKLEAKFENGILIITIPAKEEVESKKTFSIQ